MRWLWRWGYGSTSKAVAFWGFADQFPINAFIPKTVTGGVGYWGGGFNVATGKVPSNTSGYGVMPGVVMNNNNTKLSIVVQGFKANVYGVVNKTVKGGQGGRGGQGGTWVRTVDPAVQKVSGARGGGGIWQRAGADKTVAGPGTSKLVKR